MPLSEQDKQWLDQRIGGLDQRIIGLEQRVGGVEGSEQRMQQWFEQRMAGWERRLEKVETSLLTEFHKWASPTSARINSHAAAIRALDAQQEYLDDRVSKLESKN